MDALDALKLTEGDTAVKTALEQSGLDQAAFLTIFLAQLENQDPLNPQSSDELASQLAQFSQLEQSIRSMTELVGINERLDRLIDASGSETSFGLDPVALLGHEGRDGVRPSSRTGRPTETRHHPSTARILPRWSSPRPDPCGSRAWVP